MCEAALTCSSLLIYLTINFRKEIARGLFEMGIWLHPDETKAMFEAIDEDDGGTIDIDEFIAFWEGYCENTWDDDKDGIDF